MKKLLFIIIALACCGIAEAQQQLWIAGTAVPGGTQPMTAVSDGQFRYAGQLMAGELRILTTKKAKAATHYLAPVLPDANVVNHGLPYAESGDGQGEAWQVVVSDGHYRIYVDTSRHELRGEIFYPWGELFLAGGATEVGWKSEGKMLLMQRSIDNPYVWTWEGELRRHPEVEEPASFKFQGQDRWHPKALHPYVQGTDVLTEQRLRTGGDDTKWTLTKDGRYRFTIDLFNETIKAEYIK